MLHSFSLRVVFFSLLLSATYTIAKAQDQIEKVWYNQEKTSKIQVYKAKDGKFYGKIIWLKEPLRNGKPKVDEQNPDEKKRSQPTLGLIVLTGLKKDGDKDYEDGKIYDPKNGKTYSCKASYKGNTLDLRGYVGISLIGRTSTWTVAD
jgi:uncharacterized protein (DUF2147 family)